MMRAFLATHIGAKITKSYQTALQADGPILLTVAGETRLPMIRQGRPLTLEALVVEDLDVDIPAGTPFMASNDIVVCPANLIFPLGSRFSCKPHTHAANIKVSNNPHVLVASNSISLFCLEGRIYIILLG